MAVSCYRTKDLLASSDFRPQASLTDPHDGTPIDALTNFNFQLTSFVGPLQDYTNIVDEFTRRVGSDLMLREDVQLEISPRCFRLNTVTVQGQLLDHEQFHYDAAFAIGRVVAKAYRTIKAPTLPQLITEKGKVDQLHFVTRNRLIQNRYDVDSHHGTNAYYQRIWKQRMRECLANANATQIGGFYL